MQTQSGYACVSRKAQRVDKTNGLRCTDVRCLWRKNNNHIRTIKKRKKKGKFTRRKSNRMDVIRDCTIPYNCRKPGSITTLGVSYNNHLRRNVQRDNDPASYIPRKIASKLLSTMCFTYYLLKIFFNIRLVLARCIIQNNFSFTDVNCLSFFKSPSNEYRYVSTSFDH